MSRFYPYSSFTSDRLPVTGGSVTNPVTYDVASTSINLTGSVTAGGVAQANTFVPLAVAAYDGTTLLDEQVLDDGGTSESIMTDGSGDYAAVIYLPAGTDRVVVTPTFGDAPPVEFTPVASPGYTTVPVDIVSTGAGVSLDGSLTVNGAASTGMPVVSVVSFDDGDDGGGLLYVNELQTDDATVTYDPSDGSFTATSGFHASVDFLQVVVTFLEAPTVPYIRTFDVRGQSSPYAITLDIDHSPNRIEIDSTSRVVDEDTVDTGNELTDFCTAGYEPFAYELTLTALDGQAFEPGSNVIDTATFIVLPDPTGAVGDEMFDVNWALPPGTVDVGFVVSTSALYPFPELVTAEYGYRYPLGTIVDGGVTFIDDFVQGDCEPEI